MGLDRSSFLVGTWHEFKEFDDNFYDFNDLNDFLDQK